MNSRHRVGLAMIFALVSIAAWLAYGWRQKAGAGVETPTDTAAAAADSNPGAAKSPRASAEESAGVEVAESPKDRTKSPRSPEEEIEERLKRIEATYGRFLAGLTGWSAEQKESFKLQLALDGMEEHAVIWSRAEDRDEQLERLYARQRQNLQESLGPDGYERLQEYRAGLTYRPQVAAYADTMRGRGVKLTLEDEERLLRAYVNGLANGGATTAQNAGQPWVQEMTRDERREVAVKIFQVEVLRSAAAVLSKEQLAAFEQTYLSSPNAPY